MVDEPSAQETELVSMLGDTFRPVELEPRERGGAALKGGPSRYEGVVEINRGGMGAILRALDPGANREVAIKVLQAGAKASPFELQKFLTEAQVTAQLEHPNIIPVHEVSLASSGELFFSMKLVKGASLSELLASDEPPALTKLLGDFLRVCDAVAFAHSRGVVHRDLKPDNIMIGEFGEVLVMDWGLARIGDQPDAIADAVTVDTSALDGDAMRTLAGTVMGTPAYMPPEQAAGEVDRIDARSDVYALGAILYQVLTGSPPYEGGKIRDLLQRIVAGELVPPSQRASVPHELEAIVVRAMATDPDARYADVRALQADIVAYLEGRLVAVARYGMGQRVYKWLRRNRTFTAALIAVALGGVIALGLWRLGVSAKVEAIRSRIALLAPAELLKDTNALIEAAPKELSEKRTSPAPDQKRTYLERIHRLQACVREFDALLDLAPGDQVAQRRRFQLQLCTARLAALTDDWAVAELVLGRARGHEGELKAARQHLDATRALSLAFHEDEIGRIMREAAAGKLGAAGLRDAIVQLSGYREPQTTRLLTPHLDAVTTRMRTVSHELLTSVARPTKAEREAGWTDIAGLKGAVERLLAAVDEGGLRPPSQSDAIVLQRAFERLEARDGKKRSWKFILGDAQSRALASDRTLELRLELVCGVLGLLEDVDAVPALMRHVYADWRDRRAVHAGRALARLTRRSAYAKRGLLWISGVGEIRPWKAVPSAPWWQEVRPVYERYARKDDDTSIPETAEGALRVGQRAQAAGDLALARAAFDKAISRDPALGRAYYSRATLHLRNGQVSAAVGDLQRCLKLGWDEDAAVALGQAHIRAKAYGQAIQALTELVERSPESARGWYLRGRARARRNQIALAMGDLDRAIEIDRGHVPALALRGRMRTNKKEYSRAIDDFDRALAIDPRHGRALAGRAIARFSSGKKEGARADLDAAIRHAPMDSEPYLWRSRMKREDGDLRGSLADAERAVGLAPKNYRAYLERSRSRTALRDLEGARVDASQGVALAPSEAEPWALRGNARMLLGDAAGSISDLENAVQRMRKDEFWILMRLGYAYRAAGQKRKAIACQSRYIKLQPTLSTGWIERASDRISIKDWAGAIADVDQALRLAKKGTRNIPVALCYRSHAYRSLGKLDPAMADLNRAIELDPKYPTAYNFRGTLHRRRGAYRKALADFNSALSLSPGYIAARFNRALVLFENLDSAESALLELDRVLAIKPSYHRALATRGRVLMLLGRFAEAKVSYDRALSFGLTVRALRNRARVLIKLGHSKAALDDYRSAIALDAADQVTYYQRGNLRMAMKDDAGALADFSEAIRLSPKYLTARSNRAFLFLGMGKYTAALADTDLVIAIKPKFWRAWFTRGDALAALGRHAEARTAYERTLRLCPETYRAGVRQKLAALKKD